MTNKFEGLFRGKKKEAKAEPVSELKPASGLETADALKREVLDITQSRDLNDLDLGDLKKVLAKYEEMENALGISESKIEGSVGEQIESAKEIMKDEFFGPKAIENAFGIKVESKDIPTIPFGKADLERAKELNQFLVLRVDKTKDGKPLTMKKMNEMLEGKLLEGTKFLYADDGTGKIKDDAWYKDEDFFANEAPKLSWALVGKKEIPSSTGKNYLDQTREIVKYLRNQVFVGKAMPKEYEEGINEFEKKEKGIAEIIDSDWKTAAEELANLKINQLTRQAPVEVLYDIAIYFKNKGEHILENMYTWSSRRDSDGELVDLGRAGADGARVLSRRPAYSVGSLGVVFSRSS